MATEVVCGLIFRLLLPICLVTACTFRYNGLSFVYLIYLLLIPLFSEPTKTTMQGHTGRLLKSLCFMSLTFLLLHIIFQITVNSLEAANTIEPGYNCSTWEKTLRQIGFESTASEGGELPFSETFPCGYTNLTDLICQQCQQMAGNKKTITHTDENPVGLISIGFIHPHLDETVPIGVHFNGTATKKACLSIYFLHTDHLNIDHIDSVFLQNGSYNGQTPNSGLIS
ncbi:uncharacterized protein LOC121929115 [Sceloporus undulatus]|uniref:uncharacterized protein LOC121929115 n=1 Tax=Sceloporus undulatus TaxID=8520 RepID=UPI001C4B3B0D|nr:uncharacterized protein LOC121929115 [Sceloporus undulatus]